MVVAVVDLVVPAVGPSTKSNVLRPMMTAPVLAAESSRKARSAGDIEMSATTVLVVGVVFTGTSMAVRDKRNHLVSGYVDQ